MTKSLGGCWDCKELNHAEIENAHCRIDTSVKAFSSIPNNCPIQKNYIKNIDICNICLSKITEPELRYRHKSDWVHSYNIGDYVWVCGRNGDTGLVDDGEVLFHSKNLAEVLEFIQNYKEDN